MTRKTIASLAILALLLITLIGTVGAQDLPETEVTETETAEPTAEPTELPGSKFFTHPVVKLLSAYFDQEEVIPEEPVDPSAEPTEEPTDTGESESGLGPIGEAIAAYHEDGMGFGVLVKIYSMVQASEEACAAVDPGAEPTEEVGDGETPTAEPCTPLTADELVTAFQDGQGMGALMKEYGKPALMGVGHVKQALKDKDAEPTEEPTEEVTGDDAGTNPNGKPAKDKPENKPEHKPEKDKGPNK